MDKSLGLTPKQFEAIKDVEKALKTAKSLGVGFWDNYGMLGAFNAKKISLPVPVHSLTRRQGDYIELNDDMWYQLKADNFYAGNADDKLYVQTKK